MFFVNNRKSQQQKNKIENDHLILYKVLCMGVCRILKFDLAGIRENLIDILTLKFRWSVLLPLQKLILIFVFVFALGINV
jgi:hypothetical protein